MSEHTYELTITWTGNRGEGTTGLKDYDRDHTVAAVGAPEILGTADPSFLGDPARWNPEQLLTASVAQCHMLWYLGLCARAGVVVHEYVDRPIGTMDTVEGGVTKFTSVVLRPSIVVADKDQIESAEQLHEKAHEKCFVAQSVNFPVTVEPTFTVR